MPIARFQMPDGRIARFEVPEGTTPEQAQAMIQESLPKEESTPTKPIAIGKDAFQDTLRQELQNADWATRNIAGAGTALSNLYYGAKQMGGALFDKVRSPTMSELVTGKRPTVDDSQAIENNRTIASEAPVGAIAGDVATAALPFGMVGKGLKGAAAVGAGMGALQPVQGAQTPENILRGKLMNTAIGGAAGLGGQLVANKALSGVSKAMSGIENRMAEKAAQVAASETAQARSAAGNAAQNAYRQLEHLRELGANRALTPDEMMTAQMLERELAEKALDKLMPAAALKQSTADAYKEAMASEANRASQYAAEKLSGNEVKQQVMARLKRYGPAALGGAVGNFLLPGLGGAVGGAATGLVLRPAIRSMVNLSKNPAVQYGLLSPLNNSPVLTSQALPVASLLASEGLLGQ